MESMHCFSGAEPNAVSQIHFDGLTSEGAMVRMIIAQWVKLHKDELK